MSTDPGFLAAFGTNRMTNRYNMVILILQGPKYEKAARTGMLSNAYRIVKVRRTKRSVASVSNLEIRTSIWRYSHVRQTHPRLPYYHR